ncbi:MAG: hypothetical protein COA57_03950 [Flavobacteriales bacterium]|nr:MAG: hypothetical protein COA57_03950 [Flavobacteriales bacterium]
MEVGVSKKDITCFKKGVGMFGYGMYFHKVKGIETRQFVRAYVFKAQNGNKVAYVCAEILSCTISVKKGVIKKLQRSHPNLNYDYDNVLIAGTHTHSGPGGYTHYGLYNMSVPGFVPEVYTTIVDGIVESIIEADNAAKPARLYFDKGDFPKEQEIAFNRSINAYNRNADTKEYEEKERHLAVDRTMKLLRIDDLDGNPIGCINWFGVHTTSVGNDLMKICADNKGYAADFMEEDLGSKHFIAAFAQAPCGDISPNFVWDARRNRMRGKHVDDYESAKFNGKLQFEKAKEIFEKSTSKELKVNEIDFAHLNVDFSNIAVNPEFANGHTGKRTGSGCLGVSFFEGTTDGMGISKALGFMARRIISGIRTYETIKTNFASPEERIRIVEKYEAQGKKHVLIETGNRRLMGIKDLEKLPMPGWVDKTTQIFKEQYKNGSLADKPWVPDVLPLQIIILGNLAIAAMPCEPSTVSGWRLRKTILDVLKERGVEDVIISPYANGYCGYVTTNEEYQEQCYEGGHTMHGEWSLGGYQTKFKELAFELLKPKNDRVFDSKSTDEFTEDELKKRTFNEFA